MRSQQLPEAWKQRHLFKPYARRHRFLRSNPLCFYGAGLTMPAINQPLRILRNLDWKQLLPELPEIERVAAEMQSVVVRLLVID